MKNILFTAILAFTILSYCGAQSIRANDHNTIGWFNYFGTIKLNTKLSLHTEYQWRRDAIVTNWQQSLLRTGINYQINPKTQLRVGYSWIETFAYGNISINTLGRDFTEHRLYQMITMTDKIGFVEFSHRFMLEQRWVGRYSSADLINEDEFPLLNRARYMFRLQFPLKGNEIKDRTPYLAIYDEIMIGFGKNVGENIFDQNRIGILFGYRFSPKARLEAGYINQILQIGREINNQNLFQYNNGIIINTIFHFN
jgi:Protein of unknown function (DUF2490)